MRWNALIVLAAILLAVLAPQSLELMVRDGHMMIGSLDLCHSAAPALAPQGELACTETARYVHLPLLFVADTLPLTSKFAFLLFADSPEQPPKNC